MDADSEFPESLRQLVANSRNSDSPLVALHVRLTTYDGEGRHVIRERFYVVPADNRYQIVQVARNTGAQVRLLILQPTLDESRSASPSSCRTSRASSSCSSRSSVSTRSSVSSRKRRAKGRGGKRLRASNSRTRSPQSRRGASCGQRRGRGRGRGGNRSPRRRTSPARRGRRGRGRAQGSSRRRG